MNCPPRVDNKKKSSTLMLIKNFKGVFYMGSKGQKFKSYSRDFKLKVVIERINGALLTSLEKKYNIPNNSMIVRWTKEYKEMGMLAVDDKRKYTKKQNPGKGRPKQK